MKLRFWDGVEVGVVGYVVVFFIMEGLDCLFGGGVRLIVSFIFFEIGVGVCI